MCMQSKLGSSCSLYPPCNPMVPIQYRNPTTCRRAYVKAHVKREFPLCSSPGLSSCFPLSPAYSYSSWYRLQNLPHRKPDAMARNGFFYKKPRKLDFLSNNSPPSPTSIAIHIHIWIRTIVKNGPKWSQLVAKPSA